MKKRHINKSILFDAAEFWCDIVWQGSGDVESLHMSNFKILKNKMNGLTKKII